MAETSTIEWTDATWNPVTGCTKVTPGCDNCYAETFAERWRGTRGHHFESGFDLTLRPNALTLPLRWKKPRKVFVNSMSDLFHKDIPDEYIAKVFAVMALTPQHTYQILTKRHGRMRSLLSDRHFAVAVRTEMYALDRDATLDEDERWPLPNVWLGVSVEDQKRADFRVPALLETPAAVRFLSCEPLLGPVDLTDVQDGLNVLRGDDTGYENGLFWLDGPTIDWVIVGGESGRGARPMSPAWARDLRDQCQQAGVPYLFKQWGEYQPTGYMAIGARGKGCVFVGDVIDDMGHRWEMRRVGKKAAGRELDGRTWDEFPEVAS